MKPESGERRAQFVAGIGDEIGTHFLNPAQRREIVKGHQHKSAPGFDSRLTGTTMVSNQRSSGTRSEYSTRCSSPVVGAAYRFDQFGHPQRKRDRLALAEGGSEGTCMIVERKHAPVPVERDHGIRQAGDERLAKRPAAASDDATGRARRATS